MGEGVGVVKKGGFVDGRGARGICLSLARGRDGGWGGCVGEEAPAITAMGTSGGIGASCVPPWPLFFVI